MLAEEFANFRIMEKKSRLGRGLSGLMSVHMPADPVAIIHDVVHDAGTASDVQDPTFSTPSIISLLNIPTDKIRPNASQPRREFDETSLRSLSESIRNAGMIQPIIVSICEGRYELIAGERRLRAAKLAGFTQIPAIVRVVDSAQQARLALIENIHREDLNPIDRALAYRSIIAKVGYTHQELANELGEERSSIANYIRLLDLEQSVRDRVAEGKLSLGHAKVLVALDDPAEQARLAAVIISQQLSVRALEQLIKEKPVEAPPPKPVATPHLADLGRQISRHLQMHTEVRQTGKTGKGRLVIHYASLDQFDQLLHRLNVKIDD